MALRHFRRPTHRIDAPHWSPKQFSWVIILRPRANGPYANSKFGANPSTRGLVWANGWNITIYLFSPLGKLAGRATYILLALISLFLLWAKPSQDTGPIFTIFSPNERYLREFPRSGNSRRYLSFGLPWQPIFGKICEMTFIQYAAFRNGFEYCNSDLQVIKGTTFATFYAILVKIGPLTPKITQGVSVPFGKRRQKSTYHTKYLSKYWTERHQSFSIGRLIADYKTEIIFAVVEEMLLW